MSSNQVIARELAPGLLIGRYQIESRLGAGGMGEVYAATDTHLGRSVALKILSARNATPERVERFRREANAASALNHPAIVSVFDSGETEIEGQTVHYLSMERIDGDTLANWSRSVRSQGKVLEVLAQVADGLARAHGAGIVHRDLKPDNIMVAREGYAKVLDFGIAKLTEPNGSSRGSLAETSPDTILGTAAYLSPEQAEGRPVDHRSDIFSFGVVMYEVLTGRPAFRRNTNIETLHAIVHDQPPLDVVAAGVRRIVRRCLAKDPEERYQSIRDVSLDIREAGSLPTTSKGVPSRRRPLLLAGAILLVGVAGVGWWIQRSSAGVEAHPEYSQLKMARATDSGRVVTGSISPDGKYVVHVTREREEETLWVKQVATGRAVRIFGPQPVYFADLLVSPDGNYIFYTMALRKEPNLLDVFQVPILGGEPRRIARDVESSLTVSPDGRRVAFRRFNAIQRDHLLIVAEVDSGAERVALKRRFPHRIGDAAWSPDGASIAYVSGSDLPKRTVGISELNLESGSITEVNLPTDLSARPTSLGAFSSVVAPKWSGIGNLCWITDGSGLLVNAFDRDQPPQIWLVPRKGGTLRKITSDVASYDTLTITGDGKTVAAVRGEGSANLWVARLNETASARAVTRGLGNRFGLGGLGWMPDGSIIFSAFRDGLSSLFTVDQGGGEPRQLTREFSCWNLQVSPDGRHLAFLSDRSGPIEVWISDITGSGAKQLTRTGRSAAPAFFPDGKSVAFVDAAKDQTAWKISVEGGVPERLTTAPTNGVAVSPDGKWLLCRLRSTTPGTTLWRTAVLPLDGKGNPIFLDLPRGGGSPYMQWLPDSRSIVYRDWEGGVPNLWVKRINGGEPRQVTFFESGEIFAFGMAEDGKTVVLSRGDPLRDVVLIEGFR